jgi:hypothetical protein
MFAKVLEKHAAFIFAFKVNTHFNFTLKLEAVSIDKVPVKQHDV